MNILDAIKSGRRIRRKSWEDKTSFLDERSCKDAFADDWEVEKRTVTIDREQFDSAWDDATHREYDLQSVREKLIKELGL